MSAASDGTDLPSTDAAVLRARSRVYALLAACLDGDVEVLADAAEGGDFERLSAGLSVDLDGLDGSYDREALAVGYDNLFEVPGPYYVPPFASAHADDPSTAFESDSAYRPGEAGGELYGDPAADLAELYDAVEFRPERGDGIPDHVAAVFEFLGTLAATEADRREAGDHGAADDLRELQRRTLDALDWLEAFHERVRAVDGREQAFADLVAVARTFVEWDAAAGVGEPQAGEEPTGTAATGATDDAPVGTDDAAEPTDEDSDT